MDWSRVDYLWIIEMFLSAVWTLVLTAPIHCIGEQVLMQVLNFSKFVPDEETNFFWLNYSFNGNIIFTWLSQEKNR